MENTQIQKMEPVTVKQLTGYLDAMGLAQKLTDKEKTQFLEISQAFGLNPFKREIYCSKYGEGTNAQTSIIVGYETYIKRAERSGQLDGWQIVTEGSLKEQNLKAIITIYRKDRKIPFVHEVLYEEYVQTTKDGQVTKFWKKAHTMIKKVAMAQGFRLCFSDELGGMPYTKEEINNTEDADYTDLGDDKPKVLPEFFKTGEEKVLDAKAALDEATVQTLKQIWQSLSPEMQSHDDILAYGAEIKARLGLI